MGKDHSTGSFWRRLAQDAFPKPSYASSLPSSSRTTFDGNATAPTTFSSTAEPMNQGTSVGHEFNLRGIMPPASSRSSLRGTRTNSAPLAPAKLDQIFSCTDSQFGRYKSGRKAGDRLRSLNLPSTKKMVRFAVDKFQHTTAKTLNSRRLRRGPNWMQIQNMNRRAEKEGVGESGRSNITAEQLKQIFQRSHDVPQVVMPGGKGKE